MGTDAQRWAEAVLAADGTLVPTEGRPWVRIGSGASQTSQRSDFKRTWVRLGERGRSPEGIRGGAEKVISPESHES
jgi:hypothetical protein